MAKWTISGGDMSLVTPPYTSNSETFSVSFKPNTSETAVDQTYTVTYNDGTSEPVTTKYILRACPDTPPSPEERTYEFVVNFDRLNQGFTYNEECNYTNYTVTVTSRTRTNSSSPWSWVAVNGSFVGQLTNGATLNFHDDGQQGQDPTVHKCTVSINGCPNNEAVSNLKLTITQPREGTSSVSSSMTFNFRAEEAPTYEQIRIVPYIAVEQYQNPPGSDQHNRYSFQFRTVNESNPTQSVPVSTDLYFMVSDADTLKVFANGKAIDTYDCQSSSCSNENQFIVTGSNDLKNTWKISNGGWSTYQNIDLITGIDAFASLSECCKYAYQTNGILVHFNKTKNTQNSVIGVLNGLPSEANYIVEGNKQYWLDLSQQTQYSDGGQNNFYISYIEACDTHHIVKLTNRATFNAGQINEVSVSIYEDGAVFVDEASSDVATVGQNFNNITQFVDTIYPSGYIDIQACGLFNGVDLGEHCINDIVIEDGELIKRDETLPSSTRAMHIELDNENNN